MKCISGFLVLVSLHLASCSTEKTKQDQWDKQNIRDIYLSDPHIEKAFTQTQDSLDTFLNRFNTYSADTTHEFYVKTKFEEDNFVEHVWLIPFGLVDQKLKCVLANQPRDLKYIQYGDTVFVKLDQIEDFQILKENNLIFGDYIQKQLKDTH